MTLHIETLINNLKTSLYSLAVTSHMITSKKSISLVYEAKGFATVGSCLVKEMSK